MVFSKFFLRDCLICLKILTQGHLNKRSLFPAYSAISTVFGTSGRIKRSKKFAAIDAKRK